jgi:hypothetical protein
VVSIDCYRLRLDYVFGCVDKFDPVGAEAMNTSGITIFADYRITPLLASAAYDRLWHI